MCVATDFMLKRRGVARVSMPLRGWLPALVLLVVQLAAAIEDGAASYTHAVDNSGVNTHITKYTQIHTHTHTYTHIHTHPHIYT